MVTGATSGIGIPTATALARTGCNLVITARDPSKGAAALESIRKESGNPEAAPCSHNMVSQAVSA